MQPRISMITLGVSDLARALRFYADGLHFPRMESPPEVAFFVLNGTWFGLYGREKLAADARITADGSGFCGFSLAHNVAVEAHVDELIARAAAAGARITKPPAATDWGWLYWLLRGSG